MIDKRPDIEAERPDFERNALARGLSVDRNDTGSYLMAVTEYRWRGWKERARIAAEREREMQQTIDLLQADISDAKCAVYNMTPQRTVDDLKDTLDEQLGFLWPQIAALEKRERELLDLLADAQHAVCCYSCPEPREGEPDRHCETCVRIGKALTRKGPSNER